MKNRIRIYFSALLMLISIAGFSIPDNDNKPTDAEPKGGEIKGRIVDNTSNQPMEYTSIAVYYMRN